MNFNLLNKVEERKNIKTQIIKSKPVSLNVVAANIPTNNTPKKIKYLEKSNTKDIINKMSITIKHLKRRTYEIEKLTHQVK